MPLCSLDAAQAGRVSASGRLACLLSKALFGNIALAAVILLLSASAQEWMNWATSMRIYWLTGIVCAGIPCILRCSLPWVSFGSTKRRDVLTSTTSGLLVIIAAFLTQGRRLMRLCVGLATFLRVCTVANLGNFDGVHLGHQALLHTLKAQTKALNLPSLVIILNPSPKSFCQRKSPCAPEQFARKTSAFAHFDVDFVLCLPFNACLRALSAQAFIDQCWCKAWVFGI